MGQSEYEIIQHNNANYHLFLVNLLYRTPHIHRDYELSLVLDGEVLVTTPAGKLRYEKKEIFLINPYVSHEITASEPALILSLQVSPAFFSSYFPRIDGLEFDHSKISASEEDACGSRIRRQLFELALCYYAQEEYSAIRCAMLINRLFLHLLEEHPHHQIDEKERLSSVTRGNRMRRITHYIDEHYGEKLLLSDLAQQEGLDLYYLSHFFRDNFGISFQDYLSRVRCEHARQLLLCTEYSLLDICIQCGFSAPKYFNRSFAARYGCAPREYRRSFRDAHPEQRQSSMLTTQEFLSEEASCEMLERYRMEIFHVAKPCHTGG